MGFAKVQVHVRCKNIAPKYNSPNKYTNNMNLCHASVSSILPDQYSPRS